MGPKKPDKKGGGPRVDRSVEEEGNGVFRSIMAALKDEATQPGDTISIAPGVYPEPVLIDSDISLVGDGDAAECILKVSRMHAVSVYGGEVKIENLTIMQAGAGAWWALNIGGGSCEVRNCSITSDSVGCIGISGTAAPEIVGNKIHGCKGGIGVVFSAQSEGTLSENEIFENNGTGVEICEASHPVVSQNKIYNNQKAGILVYNATARPEILGNEVYRNKASAIEVREKAGPTISGNKLYECEECGILLVKGTTATVEENEIFNNLQSGISLKRRSKATVRRNNVHHNLMYGVCAFSNVGGSFDENQLTGNGSGGAWLSPRTKRGMSFSANLVEEIQWATTPKPHAPLSPHT